VLAAAGAEPPERGWAARQAPKVFVKIRAKKGPLEQAPRSACEYNLACALSSGSLVNGSFGMAVKHPFELVYDDDFQRCLSFIEPKYFSLIRDTLEEQLTFQPDVPTRNRKPLKQPSGKFGDWEIRFGPKNRFRVLYTLDLDNRLVRVLAIGEKLGNKLIIAGKEVEL